jgi:hypothetical protein
MDMSEFKQVFSFPNPVNEVAARTVAGCVAILALLAIVLHLPWISAVLAVGFLLRVASGPRFSPLGLLATKVVAPRIGHAKLVAGPPKRFAQAMGATLTIVAAVLYFAFHLTLATYLLLGAVAVAATLESALAFCLGCQIFAILMRVGVIPPEVCEACNNIWGTEAGVMKTSIQ